MTRSASSPDHAVPLAELLDGLDSRDDRGLSDDAVRSARARHGRNELVEEAPPSWFVRFSRQFRQPVILLLVVAAIVAGWTGDALDAAAILGIVLVNGIMGFVQEEKAERSLAALRRMAVPTARVVREGRTVAVPAGDLVPGDRLDLEAGDQVAADARLIRSYSLQLQEAALTGESFPVDKQPRDDLAADTPLAARANMVHRGTTVTAGKAMAVVVATGMETALGQIAGLLQRHVPEPTPLQRRLDTLGKKLIVACLGIVALIFTLELLQGGDLLEVVVFSVSLSVAAVPEGLPAVVTIALALGLQRMVRRNVVIRQLAGVETLGSVNVICSDKTGTLTRNEMTVRALDAGGERFEISGEGYVPEGDILSGSQPVDVTGHPVLLRTLSVASACNNARLLPPDDQETQWRVLGDPTEGALLVAAVKGGIDLESSQESRLSEIPFDSERKLMSVIVDVDGSRWMYTKGAPEVVLSRCVEEIAGEGTRELTEERRDEIRSSAATMAESSLRVLALACRPFEGDLEAAREDELVFCGLAGMSDSPREEALLAVERCREAGIRPVMITGDHPRTAFAVGRELGICGENGEVVTGRELDEMTDVALRERVGSISIYARVTAEHKLRVVTAWKERGAVIAMTGDGVNDAPAVQSAHIGIAMGITGTDVTKQASDMVLSDDNFASIVNAVEEGRGIFDNIRKFTQFLLSCNLGEVLFILATALLGWPVPLVAIQILWINLLTDGLPALALGLEKPEEGVMKRKPRALQAPVLSWRRGRSILLHGGIMAAVALFAFWLDRREGNELVHSRTIAFCVVSFSQLFYSLASRSERIPLLSLGFFGNARLLAAILISGVLQVLVVSLPKLQPVFEVESLGAVDWVRVGLLSLIPLVVLESGKLLCGTMSAPRSVCPKGRR